MNLFKFILITFFMGLFPILIYSNITSELAFADSAYNKGDYDKAAEAYNKVISSEGESSELLYNLGNAYARGGDYGNAMVRYLRALRLNPNNLAAQQNVEYIEQKVSDANKSEIKSKKLSVERDSLSFFSYVKKFIEADHLSDTWAFWAAGFFLLFIVCVALYVFQSVVNIRKIGFFGGCTFFVLTIIFLIFSFMAANYTSNEGVITSPKVKLRTEPSISSPESPVFLTRGTILTVLDKTSSNDSNLNWYKVRLNSDFVGWINASDFTMVEE